jgi:hypothetical protein
MIIEPRRTQHAYSWVHAANASLAASAPKHSRGQMAAQNTARIDGCGQQMQIRHRTQAHPDAARIRQHRRQDKEVGAHSLEDVWGSTGYSKGQGQGIMIA